MSSDPRRVGKEQANAMKKLAMFGLGGVVTAAAIGGGLGVAFAHGDSGGHHTDGMPMSGHGSMHMSMDPAAMDEHMQQMMGDEAFAAMRGAMGVDIYEEMPNRMGAGCEEMSGMMDGDGFGMPNHGSHHGGGGS